MSIKSKVLAGAAALSLAGGLGVAGAMNAHAATPSCTNCVEITGAVQGGALDVFKAIQHKDAKVVMWGASNFDKAEDFSLRDEGTVNQFYKGGQVSWGLWHNYKHYRAVVIEYTPAGFSTDLCLGIGGKAVSGKRVSLQPCGSPSTVWVVQPCYKDNKAVEALIQGTTTSFYDPEVLTQNGGSLFITTELNDNGIPADGQLFAGLGNTAPNA
jgi:hypothetical protein